MAGACDSAFCHSTNGTIYALERARRKDQRCQCSVRACMPLPEGRARQIDVACDVTGVVRVANAGDDLRGSFRFRYICHAPALGGSVEEYCRSPRIVWMYQCAPGPCERCHAARMSTVKSQFGECECVRSLDQTQKQVRNLVTSRRRIHWILVVAASEFREDTSERAFIFGADQVAPSSRFQLEVRALLVSFNSRGKSVTNGAYQCEKG